jgi:hypothetical protein
LNGQRIGAGVSRRAAKPARQNGFVAERLRLACQDDEYRLGDFLGQRRVAHLPQRHGINQIDVTRGERGERLLGILLGVFPQQGQVVVQDFTDIFTLKPKGNRLFLRPVRQIKSFFLQTGVFPLGYYRLKHQCAV